MLKTFTAALLGAAALVPAQASAQKYTVVAVCHTENKVAEIDPITGTTLHTFIVPGEWVGETHEGAITADGKTMYVSTPYQKQVLILDLTTFKQKGTIESPFFARPSQVRTFVRIGKRETTSADPHGVALNDDETKLYVSVEFAEPPGVVAVDLTSGKTTKIDTMSAGNYLWVQPKTNKLYFPARDNQVVVIDTRTDKVLRTIPVQGQPNGVDFSPNGDVWIVRASWSVGLAIAAPAEAATHNTATNSAEPTMPGRRDTSLMFIDTLQGPDRPSLERTYPTPSPRD